MSHNPERRKRQVLLWIGCLVVVSFSAGIWAAAVPTIEPLIRPSMAVLMTLAGLVLLSPFATSRPTDELQRGARMRISVMGAAFIAFGVAQVVPRVSVSITLISLTLLLMTAAASGRPKRFFGPRS
jgi:FtsH-binding integral membrane protein